VSSSGLTTFEIGPTTISFFKCPTAAIASSTYYLLAASVPSTGALIIVNCSVEDCFSIISDKTSLKLELKVSSPLAVYVKYSLSNLFK
jgi:hypothetical protein